MQTFLLIVATIAIATSAVAIAVLAAGLLRETRKIGRAAEDLSQFLDTAEKELSSTAYDARSALRDVDQLATDITQTTRRIDTLARSAERLLDIAHVVSAATRVTKSSSVGLASVYEGVRQGIKALYESHQINKGGTDNE